MEGIPDVKAWAIDPWVTGVNFADLMRTGKTFLKIVLRLHIGIEEIDLSNTKVHDNEMKALARFELPRLRAVRARGCHVPCISLMAYLRCVKMKCQLEELDLSGLKYKLTLNNWKEIAKLTPQLKALNVGGTMWTIDAVRAAFVKSWCHLSKLEARGCTDLAKYAHEFSAIRLGRLKCLDLRGAREEWDAEKLIDSLRPPMTHLLLGKVSGSLTGLGEKLPLYWLNLSSTDLTLTHLERIFESPTLWGLMFNECKGFTTKFYKQLSKLRQLKALSLKGTEIENEHLPQLSWKTIEDLNFSNCSNLTKGSISALDMPQIKILKLNGLPCIDDSVLASIGLPKEMRRVELEGTSGTLKGVAELLLRCNVKRLVMPSITNFEIEDGSSWEERNFLRLLPHLPPRLETVSLCKLENLSIEAWNQFIHNLPETVTSLAISDCSNFYLEHLQNVVKKAPLLKSITLCNLKIEKKNAMKALAGLKQLKFRTVYLPNGLNNGLNNNNLNEVKQTWQEQMKAAAYQGDGKAQLNLGLERCKAGALDDGIEWLKKAVTNEGGTEAEYQLACHLLKRDPNDKIGIETLNLACASGHQEALKLKGERDNPGRSSKRNTVSLKFKKALFGKK